MANVADDLAIDVENLDCVRRLRLQVYELQAFISNLINQLK